MAGVMRSEKLFLFILKNTIQMPEGLLLFSMSIFWPLIYLYEWKCHCKVIGRSFAKCTLF